MVERFSASNAGKQMSCHASANLELAIPGWTPAAIEETVAAATGTSAHSIFEKVWEYGAKDILAFARTLTYVGELRQTRRFKVLIEHSMKATWLPNPSDTTADLVLFTQDEIHVLDTKWGTIAVEAYENPQLLFYAATYGHLAPKAKGVKVHILQPRIDNFDDWFIDTNRLRLFMDEAIAAQTAIDSGSVKFGPSDHCKFCPANPHTRGAKGGRPCCPAMMQLLYPQPLDEDEILGL